jgi:diacylglycerol kinase family enzyme
VVRVEIVGAVVCGQRVIIERNERHGGCTTVWPTSLRLTSDARVPDQLDGDPGGALPLELRVLPGRLALVMPVS